MSGTISWGQYDRLSRELQDQLVQVRLQDGTTAWAHPSGQAITTVPPPLVTEAEYSRMSAAERLEYSRAHSGAPR